VNNYQIKLLAALLMVIDHVGKAFFPDIYAFRAIGRLSFPLFAWLLVQGESHTKRFWDYALRLLIFGAVSQPIYQRFADNQQLNILFTLLLGLGCLRLSRVAPQWQALIWLGGIFLSAAARFEYGAYGIAVIALIRYFQPDLVWYLSWVAIHLILVVGISWFGSFQLPAVFTPLIFQFANHQPGAKARWFYLFYPVHMLAIYLFQQWLQTN
jgi:hypothetical protein